MALIQFGKAEAQTTPQLQPRTTEGTMLANEFKKWLQSYQLPELTQYVMKGLMTSPTYNLKIGGQTVPTYPKGATRKYETIWNTFGPIKLDAFTKLETLRYSKQGEALTGTTQPTGPSAVSAYTQAISDVAGLIGGGIKGYKGTTGSGGNVSGLMGIFG